MVDSPITTQKHTSNHHQTNEFEKNPKPIHSRRGNKSKAPGNVYSWLSSASHDNFPRRIGDLKANHGTEIPSGNPGDQVDIKPLTFPNPPHDFGSSHLDTL